jgi:hypothetical protein
MSAASQRASQLFQSPTTDTGPTEAGQNERDLGAVALEHIDIVAMGSRRARILE